MTDLVTVRCGPGGHWLAALYARPGGALWLRYGTRWLLDPETFRVIPSPRPGGHIDRGIAHAPFLGTADDESELWISCRRCTRQYPMSASSGDLLSAAALARAGKRQTVIAVPTAWLRRTETS